MNKLIAAAILCVLFFANEASAQYGPVYVNRNYGFNYQRSGTTYYFNGGRQPSYWSQSFRSGGYNQQHFFRGQRRIGSYYGR